MDRLVLTLLNRDAETLLRRLRDDDAGVEALLTSELRQKKTLEQIATWNAWLRAFPGDDPKARVAFEHVRKTVFPAGDHTVTRLTGVGYSVALERPDAVADAVRAAVAQVGPSSDDATRRPASEDALEKGSTA